VAAADTVGAEAYYTGGLVVTAGETILGNFSKFVISGGVIQAIYS
jgi:hypothetical protein